MCIQGFYVAAPVYYKFVVVATEAQSAECVELKLHFMITGTSEPTTAVKYLVVI